MIAYIGESVIGYLNIIAVTVLYKERRPKQVDDANVALRTHVDTFPS